MKRKVLSIFFVTLIAAGIFASMVNFSTRAYASPPAIYGTTTQETSLFWQLVYYLQGRWLYDNYYCIGQASDCSIVN